MQAKELIIANKKLAFQNEEKKKRAEELIIANIELAFQNREKEKRVAELINANKELEAFSYSVSHDLRAPLRHINGYVDLLLSRFYDSLPEKGRHYLDNIADSSTKMGTLIDDLLQFSRIGRQVKRLVNFDMNIIVNEVLVPIKQDNHKRIIEWRIATLPHVYADQVILTSSREEQDLITSYELGVNAYVVKPVDFKQFIEAVKQIGSFWAVLNELPPEMSHSHEK